MHGCSLRGYIEACLPDHSSEETGKGLVRINQMAGIDDAEEYGSAEEPQKNHRRRRGDRHQ